MAVSGYMLSSPPHLGDVPILPVDVLVTAGACMERSAACADSRRGQPELGPCENRAGIHRDIFAERLEE